MLTYLASSTVTVERPPPGTRTSLNATHSDLKPVRRRKPKALFNVEAKTSVVFTNGMAVAPVGMAVEKCGSRAAFTTMSRSMMSKPRAPLRIQAVATAAYLPLQRSHSLTVSSMFDVNV